MVKISLFVSIILLLLYVILLFAERKWPLRHRTHAVLQRMVVNLTFTLLVYIASLLLINPIIHFALYFTKIREFGIVPWLHLNIITGFIFGFLMLDLTFYYWHRMNHEIALLWRFHNVHHVDPDLDVTTSMRFHVIEIAYSGLFRLVQLIVIGVNPLLLVCYEFAFQANTFFQHSNIKLPIKLEKIVNIIFVTPRMHGIHHSFYQSEVNRNYGVVFSFWDRLHKTGRLNIKQNDIRIGVPAYLQPNDNKVITLLVMPFKRQRSYWQVDGKKFLKREPGPSKQHKYDLAE